MPAPDPRAARGGAAPAYDLRFVTSGGAAEGIGHLARCAEIAREARARGLRVELAVRGDTSVRSVLGDLPVVDWTAPSRLAADTRWLAFDTKQPIDSELRRARRAGTRSLVLDRLDHLERADWTVIPALHAPPLQHPRLSAGASWVPLPPPLRRPQLPPYPGTRDALVVSLGGSDPRSLTAPVCRAVDEALDRTPPPEGWPTRHVLLGPAIADRDALAAQLLGRGWTVHPRLEPQALGALLARSRGAVVAFGTTILQLAHLGVPTVYVTHRAEDVPDAVRLEAIGVGRLGADGGFFARDELVGALRKSLFDAEWCLRASSRGRALAGDGRGAARLVDRLFPESRR